jgi:hypothetical protein
MTMTTSGLENIKVPPLAWLAAEEIEGGLARLKESGFKKGYVYSTKLLILLNVILLETPRFFTLV